MVLEPKTGEHLVHPGDGPFDRFPDLHRRGRPAASEQAGVPADDGQRAAQLVGEHVEQTSSSTSKSAVSRRFVKATETALTEQTRAFKNALTPPGGG